MRLSTCHMIGRGSLQIASAAGAKRIIHAALGLVFVMWVGCGLVSAPAVAANRCAEVKTEGLHLSFAMVTSASLSLESLLAAGHRYPFRPLASPSFSPPQQSAYYWVKAHFRAPETWQGQSSWVLQVSHSGLSRFHVYVPQSLSGRSGWQRHVIAPYGNHGFSHDVVFPFGVSACAEISFYLRLKTAPSSHWSGEISLKARPHGQWLWQHDLLRLLCGLYYGVIFGLLVVQLFLFLWLRDATAGWFVLYHVALAFFMLCGNGLFNPLFAKLSLSPVLYFRIQELLLGLFILAAMLYTRSFLQTQATPRIDRLLLVYTWLVVVYLFCALWAPVSFVGNYSQILGLLSPLATIVPGWIYWRRGFPPALIYLVAWGIFSLASFFFAAPVFDEWGFYVFQAGSGVSAILLSLAMVQRIRLLREEREQAELQSRQAEKMATLGQLVAGVAHEINNPTNLITFNVPILRQYIDAVAPHLETLEAGQPGLKLLRMPLGEFLADAHKLLDSMEHGASRIAGIVGDLRGYVRSQEATSPAPIAAAAIIEGALHLVGKQVAQQVPQLDIDIEPDLPLLWLRPGRLEQVLINLLLNAAQAAKASGAWIKVRVKRHPQRSDQAMLEVEDNGAGIPAALLDNIFAPFFTTKGREANMGLGLSISRRIVEEHGGEITVESVEHTRTCFRISLPWKEGQR